MSLLRALRRRLALGLGFLLAAIAGPAPWFFLPPAKFQTQAKLLVRPQQPQIVDSKEHQAGEDYKRYQKTQLGLIKSRWAFNAALGALRKDPEFKSSTLKVATDPIKWLQENLDAQFLPESELMEIGLSGNEAEELAKIVNAVTTA